MCGHLWGLDMTATTAMPDAVLTGFALNLKHALLISACRLAMDTATAAQHCCSSHDKIAKSFLVFGQLGYVQVQHFWQ